MSTSQYARPSTHVVLHEDTIERESPQGTLGLAPPVSSLLQNAETKLPSQIEYVSACLAQVRRRSLATGVKLPQSLFPHEDLAYELQSNYYDPKVTKLVAQAQAQEDESKNNPTNKNFSQASQQTAKPKLGTIQGDIIVTEDQLPLDALAASLVQLGYNSDSHLGLTENYNPLSSFEARVDYVYRCLKSVENQKRSALKLKQRVNNSKLSNGAGGPVDDDSAYEAATATLMAEAKLAMNLLADELAQTAERQKALKAKL